ncbi:MAG: 30S ribosomal protein S1 [Bacteroidetes bacterium]|nr:MAG: 30S ribosomal protein S1 [Bacteroidota bacterium]
MAEDQRKEETTTQPEAEAPATPENEVIVEETAATEQPEASTEAPEPAAEAPEDEAAATAEAPAAEAEASEAPAADDAPAAEATATVEVPPAETGAPSAEATADVPEPTADGQEEAAPTRDVVGYTGERTGKVVKLEDLEKVQEEEEQAPVYAELMKLVEETLTSVTEGEIIKGHVVSVGDKDVVIDIGFKSDGIVPKNEFDEELQPGDEVEVFVERIEDYQGQLVLSKTKADAFKRWRRIEEAYENEEVIEGTIVRRIKGGMIVELFNGMEAFLPGSQIDVRPVRDFDAYLDKRMEFKIVKLNPANENIVVSHKALIEKDLEEQRKKILSTMEPGQILEGTVKNITDFGVFIDLGGVDGLLHITDLSWGRVSHPSELVSLDEKLNVVVLDYDKERQRISLGLKQLQPHPWDNIHEKYSVGDVVEGKVVSITDYGAFVELEKGIEGLVHISEMSWTEHIKHPSQMVSLGQIVKVKILNIDFEGKKISLGMKQLEPDPWDNIAERYPPGTVLRGKVRNITNFGVFVEIEPGIDGLVHISDLSWTKKIRHPSEMVKKGQEMDVVVLNIDPEERRISLGHKQGETNPWNQLANVYAEGAETEGTITRIEDKGIAVELPLEVEGFIPVSELKERTNHREHYHVGDQLTGLTVIRFDAGQKEIILSEVAAERARERAERQQEAQARRAEKEQERKEVEAFTKKATSGPTTLAELSGLADLKRKLEQAEAAEMDETASEAEGEKPVSATEGGSSVAEVEASEEARKAAEEALSEAETPAEEDEAKKDEEA